MSQLQGTRHNGLGTTMKKFIVLMVFILLLLAGCGEVVAPAAETPTPTPTLDNGTCNPAPCSQEGTTPAPETPTAATTTTASLTATPDHPNKSIQDAAQHWSHGTAESGISNNVVWVTDTLTSIVMPDEAKWDCYNIQQAEWYGLLSTINQDGSTTIVKSQFSEVDVSVIYNGQSAICNLTSSTADVIDKQGMWDDGDFLGAWELYDRAYLPTSLS